MKVIEVGVSDQDEINLREILDSAASVLEPLHEENPVRKIWIDKKI